MGQGGGKCQERFGEALKVKQVSREQTPQRSASKLPLFGLELQRLHTASETAEKVHVCLLLLL